MCKIFPVIHCHSIEQAERNLLLAKDLKADGVMLINMGDIYLFDDFFNLVKQLADYNSKEFEVGVNWLLSKNLGYELKDSSEFTVKSKLTLNWVDNSRTDMNDSFVKSLVEEDLRYRNSSVPTVTLFGGVNFKYQTYYLSMKEAVLRAIPFVDVITLSGDKTGSPPKIEDIQSARKIINSSELKRKLAIASGISIENINDFKNLTDYVLVASSLLDKNSKEEDFDKQKLHDLVEACHDS